jgi:hypothetical protein
MKKWQFHCIAGGLVLLVAAGDFAQAAPQRKFGPLSTTNPNVRSEMRQTTTVLLEGFGDSWPRITGLDQRAGIQFRNQGATLGRLVTSLHPSGKGQPWDGFTSSDQIRVYLYKDKSLDPDMIWCFLRDRKAYCVPELCDWSARRYVPQKRMFLLKPVARRRFVALIRSIAKDARRHSSRFTLIDFGGD